MVILSYYLSFIFIVLKDFSLLKTTLGELSDIKESLVREPILVGFFYYACFVVLFPITCLSPAFLLTTGVFPVLIARLALDFYLLIKVFLPLFTTVLAGYFFVVNKLFLV